MTRERTFVIVKPDGVTRGLVGEVIKRFEHRGYKLVGAKLTQITDAQAKDLYQALSSQPFFAGLVKHISSSPAVVLVWEGHDVVVQARRITGETDPLKSTPGSIRGDYAIELARNVIHASDSVANASREINIFFKAEEVLTWTSINEHLIYE